MKDFLHISRLIAHPAVSVNGPPDDDKCMVCGRHVRELHPISIPVVLDPSFQFDIVIDAITLDWKLARTFRGVDYVFEEEGQEVVERVVGKSWECQDCLCLDPDVVEKILLGNNG